MSVPGKEWYTLAMDNLITSFEFFQTDGYDATIAAATKQFEGEHPLHKVREIKFIGAYPGGRDGRWVTMAVVYGPTDQCKTPAEGV